MDEDEALLTRVSYHAVMDYLRHVHGVEAEDVDAIDPLIAARRSCAAAGVDLDEVRRMILSPTVKLGLRLGACTVSNANFVAVIRANGPSLARTVVVAIEARRERQRIRHMSDAENRRLSIQRWRRQNPSWKAEAAEL